MTRLPDIDALVQKLETKAAARQTLKARLRAGDALTPTRLVPAKRSLLDMLRKARDPFHVEPARIEAWLEAARRDRPLRQYPDVTTTEIAPRHASGLGEESMAMVAAPAVTVTAPPPVELPEPDDSQFYWE